MARSSRLESRPATKHHSGQPIEAGFNGVDTALLGDLPSCGLSRTGMASRDVPHPSAAK